MLGRRTVLVAFALCVASVLAADPRLIYRSDPVYSQVRRLALQARVAPPSRTSPITAAELTLTLDRISTADLTESQIAEYQRLRDLLAVPNAEVDRAVTPDATEAQGFEPVGTVGIEAAAELYLHTAGDADEWMLWYPDRKPLLSIPMRARPFGSLAIEFDLDWRKNYPLYPGSGLSTVNPDPISNIPGDMRESDVQFPYHALVSVGGERWSVQFGRSRVALGFGEGGSLFLSDHVDYHEFLLASVFGHLFSYRALYLDLESWSSSPPEERMFFAHRIEMRPFDWLSLAANDGFIVAEKPIELRYYNPLMIMHSWFVPNFGNSILNFEFAVRPLPGLELYGHLGIDQLSSAVERERGYADGEPQALGFLAGAQYVWNLSNIQLTSGSEWVFLDPWMYLGRTELGSFTYRRRVQAENVLPSGAKVLVEKSLGYPEGPDFYELAAYTAAEFPGGHAAAVELSFGARGENAVGRFLPPEDEADALRVTPSGPAPEFIFHTRLSGDAVLGSFQIATLPVNLHAGGVLDFIRVINNDHQAGAILADLQFSPYILVDIGY